MSRATANFSASWFHVGVLLKQRKVTSTSPGMRIKIQGPGSFCCDSVAAVWVIYLPILSGPQLLFLQNSFALHYLF